MFVLLFVGLSLPPAFFLRYRTLDWKARYEPLRPVVLFFVIFLLMHTLVRHKEERFMIPLLPLFLMLLTPLLAFLIAHRDQYRWRLAFLGVVNGVLLALAVTSAPQRATIELTRYVDAHPEITTISRVGDFIQVPTVFVSHPVTLRESKELDEAALDCSGVVAVLALTKTGKALAADPRLTRGGGVRSGAAGAAAGGGESETQREAGAGAGVDGAVELREGGTRERREQVNG